jgi:putative sterol carrier protein
MEDGPSAADVIALHELAPAAVARAIAVLPEGQLREMLRGDARAAVLDEIFRRFPEYIDPARIGDVEAVIEWRIADGGSAARYAIVIERGACHAHRDLPADPRVTFELGALDFLRLVTGNVAPGVLFLSGRLRLRGDELFAVELAGYFRIPTADGADQRAHDAIDPARADAREVAGVVRDAPDDRLRAAMRGEIRELILDEVFRRFPEYVDDAKIAGARGAIEWKITGRPDGRYDRYLVAFEHGEVRTGRDLDAKPRLTIRLDGVDFLKLATGNANPTMSFIRGRLRLKGDVAFAAQLPGLFRIPSPD